jgi:hypothetical protein
VLDFRDVLATVDKPLTVVLEPLGEGKIRVRTGSWDQEVVILDGQVLEAVALGKSLRLVRAPKPLEYLDYEPTGFADAGCGDF